MGLRTTRARRKDFRRARLPNVPHRYEFLGTGSCRCDRAILDGRLIPGNPLSESSCRAARYRTTLFKTRDGQTHTGIVSFESADGVIVLTGATSAVRLAETDIVARYPGNLSLMPGGLLNGLRPEQLADLYSHLKTLTPKSQ